MKLSHIVPRAIMLAGLLAGVAAPAQAADISVVSSGGFAAAYRVLAPVFEKQTGNHLVIAWGPSMGDTADTVPARLARHEPIDVVIMVGYALDKLVADGRAVAGSQMALARSGIGAAVRAGSPVPDISTDEALKRTLLAAPSVGYSDSASGVYIEKEMFKKLGIAAEMEGKAHMIPAEPVGGVVARGDVALGFQQISELKPVQGITLVGPLPAGVQKFTVFSAGVTTASHDKEAARALIRFLASPEAAAAITASGMEPMGLAAPK